MDALSRLDALHADEALNEHATGAPAACALVNEDAEQQRHSDHAHDFEHEHYASRASASMARMIASASANSAFVTKESVSNEVSNALIRSGVIATIGTPDGA